MKTHKTRAPQMVMQQMTYDVSKKPMGFTLPGVEGHLHVRNSFMRPIKVWGIYFTICGRLFMMLSINLQCQQLCRP